MVEVSGYYENFAGPILTAATNTDYKKSENSVTATKNNHLNRKVE
jgi:hypothetical protein